MFKDLVCPGPFKPRVKWRWVFTSPANVAHFRASVKRQLSLVNEEQLTPAGEWEEKGHSHRRL